MTPDPDQQRVIDAGPGYWLVQAGPGAGKSETVLNRFVRLVESGEDPADILALSFTSAAAKNLRDRAAKRLVRKMDTDRLAGWMTLHSFALQFTIREREQFPFPLEEHPLMPEAQSIKICWEAGKRFDCDPRRLKNYIGLQKRRGVRPIQAIREAEKEHKDEKLALAYKAYQNKMYEAAAAAAAEAAAAEVRRCIRAPEGRSPCAVVSQSVDRDRWLRKEDACLRQHARRVQNCCEPSSTTTPARFHNAASHTGCSENKFV